MNTTHIGSLDANLLIALDALLGNRSVTRAARRLGITQSAMSHKLRRLRELFGDVLLVPSAGGMLPTPKAEAIAHDLRLGVEALERALDREDAFDPCTAIRTHTVISSDYAELVIMPHVVARGAEIAPGIETHLIPHSDHDAARLAEGTADVHVGPPLEGPGLKRRVLYEEGILCAVAADHPSVGETLTMKQWLALDQVVFASPAGPSDVVCALSERGLSHRVKVRTPHWVGGPMIAARSRLVFTGSSAPIRTMAEVLPLRVLPPPPPFRAIKLPVIMTWHERYDQDPAARWLRDFTANTTIEAVARHGLGPLANASRPRA